MYLLVKFLSSRKVGQKECSHFRVRNQCRRNLLVLWRFDCCANPSRSHVASVLQSPRKPQTPKFVCGLAVIGGRSQLHKVPWESWDAEVLKSRSGGSFISLTKSTARATMKKSFAPRSVSDSGKADDDGLVRNLTLTRALSSVHSKEGQSITVANFRCQNTHL